MIALDWVGFGVKLFTDKKGLESHKLDNKIWIHLVEKIVELFIGMFDMELLRMKLKSSGFQTAAKLSNLRRNFPT